MSISLMTDAWKSSLPMTEKMVLLCLADFANDRGECWPSVDTIAAKCSCSDRTVQKAIRSLSDAGILTIQDAPGKAHSFTINPRKLCTPENPSPPKMSAKGVNDVRPRGEARSPKPSLNHQEPSKEKHTKRAMPAGWVPEVWPAGSTCRGICDEWPPGEYETQVEHFTAHHRSKGSRFVDWQDAWKTWVLNSRKWNKGNGKSHSGIQRAAGKPVDGVALALDRRLGLDGVAGTSGRRDAGSGAGNFALPAPAARAVR